MNKAIVAVAGAVIGATAFTAGCTGTAKKPSPSPSSATTSPPASPSVTPSSPAPTRAAHVGEKFTIKAEDGTSYDVTLLQVAQQATPADEFSTPAPGKHLSAAEFRVTAITAVDENANNNANLVGSNSQTYTPSFLSVSEGTNFANGSIKLQPGASSIGWVSFEVPDGVAVAKVVWTASAGFSAATCEWLVP